MLITVPREKMMDVEFPTAGKVMGGDCWSLGSQCQSGRFPKVSIGITLEKAARASVGSKTKDGKAMFVSEKAAPPETCLQDNSAALNNSQQRVESKSSRAPGWVSPKPAYAEIPTRETHHDASAGKGEAALPDDLLGKTECFLRSNRREGGNSEKICGDTFAVPQDRVAQENASAERVNQNNGSLRMKLWEILGNGSQNKEAPTSPYLGDAKVSGQKTGSQNKEAPTSPYLGDAKVSGQKRVSDQKNSKARRSQKPNQLSDPIETDSDNPDQVQTRPVTRSLARKRAPRKLSNANSTTPGLKNLGTKQEKQNIFNFDDGEGKTGDNGCSRSTKRARGSNKKARVEPVKINFEEPRVAGKLNSINRRANMDAQRGSFDGAPASNSTKRSDGEAKPCHSSKVSFKSKETEHSSCLPGDYKNKRLPVTPNINPQMHKAEKHVNGPALESPAGSPIIYPSPNFKEKSNSWKTPMAVSPLGDDSNANDEAASPLFPRFRSLSDEMNSPTFAMNLNKTSQRSIRKPVSSRDHVQNMDSPASALSGSDQESDSLDETCKTPKSDQLKSPFYSEESEHLSQHSPMEDHDTGMFSPIFSKGNKSSIWMSETENLDRAELKVHRKKGPATKDKKESKINLPPLSNFGVEDADDSDRVPEQFSDTSLARAVNQLVLVLGRFKAKVKSQTSKRSSDVLSATLECIQHKLTDAQSQMHADIEKFVTAAKSKRDFIESNFQEQHERLQTIHDKFREDACKLLSDCKRTLDEFNSYQMELKGNADDQRATHKKLLQEVDGAIHVQLQDAEAKIAEINKGANKKMAGLKRALVELLGDDTS